MSEELTRTISREQAEEWGLPRDLYEDGAIHADAATEIARERLDEHRWYVVKRVIFIAPDDGEVWAAEYCEGLSETQEDTDPWYQQDRAGVEITRFEQFEKTVTAWRPVGSEPAPASTGDGQQAAPSSVIVRDMLLLAGEDVPTETIGHWTLPELLEVTAWAAAEHLHASDNPVKRLPRPSVLGGAQ